jgi:hypothetical protein
MVNTASADRRLPVPPGTHCPDKRQPVPLDTHRLDKRLSVPCGPFYQDSRLLVPTNIHSSEKRLPVPTGTKCPDRELPVPASNHCLDKRLNVSSSTSFLDKRPHIHTGTNRLDWRLPVPTSTNFPAKKSPVSSGHHNSPDSERGRLRDLFDSPSLGRELSRHAGIGDICHDSHIHSNEELSVFNSRSAKGLVVLGIMHNERTAVEHIRCAPPAPPPRTRYLLFNTPRQICTVQYFCSSTTLEQANMYV